MYWDLDLGASAPGLMSLQTTEPEGEEEGGLQNHGEQQVLEWGFGLRSISPAFPMFLLRLAWATPGPQGSPLPPALMTRVQLSSSDLTSVTNDLPVPNLALAVWWVLSSAVSGGNDGLFL